MIIASYAKNMGLTVKCGMIFVSSITHLQNTRADTL